VLIVSITTWVSAYQTALTSVIVWCLTVPAVTFRVLGVRRPSVVPSAEITAAGSTTRRRPRAVESRSLTVSC